MKVRKEQQVRGGEGKLTGDALPAISVRTYPELFERALQGAIFPAVT